MQVQSRAHVLDAAKRTLDGFCATHYTSVASKKETVLQSVFHRWIAIARQPSIRTHNGPNGPVHVDILASAATLTAVLQRQNLHYL